MPLSKVAISRRLFVGGVLASAMAGTAPALAQSPAALVSRGPLDRPEVALTFDCGSDRGYTDLILDTLAASAILASFGVTGAFADAHPDLVRRMVEEGHDLVNHSYSHPSFTGANTSDAVLTTEARLDQLERTEDALVAACGRGGKPLFRPPYGDVDDSVLADLGVAGFTHSVMWTIDIMGWAGWSQAEMIERVRANHGNGYIYLMHVGGQSLEGPALPSFIEVLSGQGYGYTRISDMIGLDVTAAVAPAPVARTNGPVRLQMLDLQNLRVDVGLGADILAVIPPSTVVTVLSGPRFMDGYTWYEVASPYGRGWVAADFLEPTEAFPTPPRPGLPPERRPD